MKIVIGMCESFDPLDYVSAVIAITPILLGKSDEWLEIIHNRIFNSDKYLSIYECFLKCSDEEIKEKTLNFIYLILNKETPKYDKIFSMIESIKDQK